MLAISKTRNPKNISDAWEKKQLEDSLVLLKKANPLPRWKRQQLIETCLAT